MDGIANSSQVKWSKWSACESSFSLLLVPQQPGVFALAEEVVPAGDGVAQTKRMLAILEVGAADDLARSLSRLFAVDSIYHQRLSAARCYVRYAVIAEAGERQAVAAAMQQWLATQSEAIDVPAPAAPAAHSNQDLAPRDLRPAPLPAGF
ncbi:MAG TPA: hypothetical protein VGQ94_10140 [Terriglobales bacterium]|jgi:hypothetical protein|nr:hypothetical protein [Terriglobales bacterium]